MKKLYVLIFLLVELDVNGQTFVYHPFPDSSAIWNISSIQSCSITSFDWWTHSYSYHITNDTLINGIVYHMLEVPSEVIVTNGGCGINGSWTIPGHYAGSIRQDILNKKVFIIPPASITEELLYDFDLQVGDTVTGFTQSFASPNDVVNSIDSILIGGNYRKRWNINSLHSISIIEGIGSTYGLLELSPGNAIIDAYDATLSCFSNNGITLYPNAGTNCELITSIKHFSPETYSCYLTPNPFNLFSTLTVGNKFENAELKIYDCFGKIIKTDKLNGENYLLNRNNLVNGIYFLQLINNNIEANTVKFIVE